MVQYYVRKLLSKTKLGNTYEYITIEDANKWYAEYVEATMKAKLAKIDLEINAEIKLKTFEEWLKTEELK